MSRIIALALLAFSSPASAAAPQTAEQAMKKNYRLTFKPPEPRDCARQPGEETAVCAKRDLPDQRLAPALEPEAGERIAGEPPSALSGSQRCSNVGPNQDCGGGVPLLGDGAVPAQIGGGAADRNQ
jgi:hypothetical protein